MGKSKKLFLRKDLKIEKTTLNEEFLTYQRLVMDSLVHDLPDILMQNQIQVSIGLPFPQYIHWQKMPLMCCSKKLP